MHRTLNKNVSNSRRHACPGVKKGMHTVLHGDVIHTSDNDLYPNAEKLFSADRSIPCMHIFCESNRAIHRSCYNIPFGGSFVSIVLRPRTICNSLYVWKGLVSHSIAIRTASGSFQYRLLLELHVTQRRRLRR